MNNCIRALTVLAAVAALNPAFADEDDESLEDEVAEATEDSEDSAEAAVGQAQDAVATFTKPFYTLPVCGKIEGRAEVRINGSQDWVPVEDGRYYPLGSAYRTSGVNAKLTVSLGTAARVEIAGDASFSTRPQGLAEATRTLVLDSGTIDLILPRNFKEGLLTITAPGFVVENPNGESRYTYRRTNDGDEATVRCVTGALQIKGPHFKFPALHAANEVKITTSQDQLFTGLYGVSGDYAVILDQGLVQHKDLETQETKIESASLEWKLSPLTAARIHRAKPALGEKLAVTVMTFDASGKLKNRRAFTEGRFEINTGEQGPTTKAERADLEKRAAEAAQAENVTEEDASETTEESDDSSSDDDSDDDF